MRLCFLVILMPEWEKSSELADVIGMFGEGKYNACGNRLISFLNEVELVVCNCHEFTVEPQWTRARPSLKQKSIIDCIVTDSNLLQVSGSVQVDTVEYRKIGSLSGMDGIG